MRHILVFFCLFSFMHAACAQTNWCDNPQQVDTQIHRILTLQKEGNALLEKQKTELQYANHDREVQNQLLTIKKEFDVSVQQLQDCKMMTNSHGFTRGMRVLLGESTMTNMGVSLSIKALFMAGLLDIIGYSFR